MFSPEQLVAKGKRLFVVVGYYRADRDRVVKVRPVDPADLSKRGEVVRIPERVLRPASIAADEWRLARKIKTLREKADPEGTAEELAQLRRELKRKQNARYNRK